MDKPYLVLVDGKLWDRKLTKQGAELVRTIDETIAEPIVRAVNAHEELLGFIQSEFDECCGKFKTFCEPCKRRLDVIAKAEGR